MDLKPRSILFPSDRREILFEQNEILFKIANFKGFVIESIIFVSEHRSEKAINNRDTIELLR